MFSGIQVGVSVNLFIRLPGKRGEAPGQDFISRCGAGLAQRAEYEFLESKEQIGKVKWEKLTPDKKGNWITNGTDEEFEAYIPIGSKEAKAAMGLPSSSLLAGFRQIATPWFMISTRSGSQACGAICRGLQCRAASLEEKRVNQATWIILSATRK